MYQESFFWHIFYSKYLHTFYIEETLHLTLYMRLSSINFISNACAQEIKFYSLCIYWQLTDVFQMTDFFTLPPSVLIPHHLKSYLYTRYLRCFYPKVLSKSNRINKRLEAHRFWSLLRKEDKSKRCKVYRESGKIYYKGIVFTGADEVLSR